MSLWQYVDAERFWGNVEKIPFHTCWEWRRSVFQGTGYGQTHTWDGRTHRTLLAHRVAWMLANRSDIPDDLHVLHSCDNKTCVRPEHLRLGTPRDNIHDAIDRRRNPRLLLRRGETCQRGHAWDRRWNGRPACSQCNAASVLRYKLRRQGVAVPKLKTSDRGGFLDA